MDLRVKKTKQLIKSTFLDLRKENSLEKIKVRELCRIAEINKSTFYHHYLDIYDLSDKLEDEIIENIFNQFKGKELLFEDPMSFFSSLPIMLDRELLILFKGNEQTLFFKMERQLLDYYSNYLDTDEQKIRLSFLIGGAMRVFQRFLSDKSIDQEKILSTLAEILEEISF